MACENQQGPSAANEPSRFKVGDRVEVKISHDSEPGSESGVDMISIYNCDGGRWVRAKVTSLRYQQDGWCPGFYCAYTVKVQGDVTPDGVPFMTPVREDDERCIRAAPPLPKPPPPRFAIGARVECNGGDRGWRSGIVREIWPEAPDGTLLPYRVELESGDSVLIPHDEDLGVRLQHVVEYNAWDDTKGVEAVYDLLVDGKLCGDRGLPAVGLCDPSRVDALSDAVAACGSERRRVALMLEQILATAEQATPLHVLVGQRVRVRGLSNSPALNGKVGTATRYVAERERYEVQFDDDGTTVGVRDVNLAPAKEPMVTCPICMHTRMTDPIGPAPKGPGDGKAHVTHCCGKVVCPPCHEKYMVRGLDRVRQTFPPCPFCRAPTGYMDEHADNRVMRELLKRRATQGDPIAMYNLSGSYDQGRYGLPRDYQASIVWAALAAMVGKHVRAMNNVAFALKDGEGIPSDEARSLPWFRRAACLDSISCIWALGKAYMDGLGVAPDPAAAQRWLKRGKDMGDMQSAFDLSKLAPPHGEPLGAGGFSGFGGMPPELVQMMMARGGA